MKHIHAELIKAWADGAIIESRLMTGVGWTKWQEQHGGFIWYEVNAEYRIKPEPKPDIHNYYRHNVYTNTLTEVLPCERFNLSVTVCGETGKLKSAEVIE